GRAGPRLPRRARARPRAPAAPRQPRVAAPGRTEARAPARGVRTRDAPAPALEPPSPPLCLRGPHDTLRTRVALRGCAPGPCVPRELQAEPLDVAVPGRVRRRVPRGCDRGATPRRRRTARRPPASSTRI